MLRLITCALFAFALFGQGNDLFNRPPAEVDKALRARITEFFKYHAEGQFRKAEELVAEDTKDFFYTHNKPRYGSFEIMHIEYFDNFTRAKATVLTQQQVMMPGFGGNFKVPTPSTWKLENGKWCWYVDMAEFNKTPFGNWGANAQPADGAAAPQSGTLPSAASLMSADFALHKVTVDKPALTLKAGESATAVFTNSAPGMMRVSLAARTPGIEVTPNHLDLKQGEKASVTVKAREGAKSAVVNFRVDPSAEIISVKVAVE